MERKENVGQGGNSHSERQGTGIHMYGEGRRGSVLYFFLVERPRRPLTTLTHGLIAILPRHQAPC